MGPQTGEQLNIEAANAGGLADYPDEHYRSWPTKLDPKDVETGGALKTLTMREFLAVKIAARGDYYWHKGQRPEAQVSYALAHQFYPASRTIYETLAGQVHEEQRQLLPLVQRVADRLSHRMLGQEPGLLVDE